MSAPVRPEPSSWETPFRQEIKAWTCRNARKFTKDQLLAKALEMSFGLIENGTKNERKKIKKPQTSASLVQPPAAAPAPAAAAAPTPTTTANKCHRVGCNEIAESSIKCHPKGSHTYCSKACQISNKKNHKKECQHMKVKR